MKKTLLAAALSLLGVIAYSQECKVRNLEHPIDGYDNYSMCVYYYNGGDIYNLKSVLVGSGDKVVDFRVSPTNTEYAVLSASKNGKKNAISTYNSWAKEAQLAHKSNFGFKPTLISYDSKGQWIAAHDTEGVVHMLYSKNLVERGTLQFKNPVSIMKASVKNHLVGANNDLLEVFDLTNREKLKELKFPANINDVAFSDDGALMGVLTADGKLKVFNTKDFNQEYSYEALGVANSFSFTPNTQYIGVQTGPKRILIMNILNDQKREYVDAPELDVKNIRFIKCPGDSKSYLMYHDGKAFTFYDVTNLSPMRSQLLADRLDEKMKEWEQQLPGETLDDYALRVNDQTRLEQIKLFEQEVLGEMVLGEIGLTAMQVGNYNNELQLMELSLNTGLNDIYLSVPPSDISSFLSPDDIEFKNVVYGINKNDDYVVMYADVYNKNNGKTYTYNNIEGQYVDFIVDEAKFVPVQIIHQASLEENSLADLTQSVIEEAKKQNILSDHTHITVDTRIVPDVDKDGLNIKNYEVGISYTVDAQYSAQEDFPAGKYELEQSSAGMAMMKIVDHALKNEFAKYMQPGKTVQIEITGTADASPIRNTIAYNGVYGNFKNQPVIFDGNPSTITINEKGISSNEQLAFLRAEGVEQYLKQNIPALKDMHVTTSFMINVASEAGSEYRKVGVRFNFIDAF